LENALTILFTIAVFKYLDICSYPVYGLSQGLQHSFLK